MAMNTKLIDKMLEEYKTPEEILGENGLLKQLTKAVLERALNIEMNTHLGYAKYALHGKNSGNSRNGNYPKKVKGEFGELNLEIPRDRNAEFEPIILPKGQTRFENSPY